MEDVTSRPTHRLSSCILLLISLLILHNREDGRSKREDGRCYYSSDSSFIFLHLCTNTFTSSSQSVCIDVYCLS